MLVPFDSMDRLAPLPITVLFVPLVGACLAVGCANDGHEEAQYRRSTTPVAISYPAEVSVSVFSAGETLDDVHPVHIVADDPLWLTPGRWMIEARADGRTWHYPATLTGFRSGPDAGGSLIISIRRQAEGETPAVPGMTFVTIPSGWFLLGDRRSPLEPHFVWQSAMHVAEREVSNEQFRMFLLSSTGAGDDAHWSEAGRAWRRQSSSRCSATLVPIHPEYQRFGRDDQPVTQVTWYEAHAYCRWLTKTYGGGRWLFGLPTESEWEKAARGPDDLDYGLSQEVSDRESSWYNWRKNPGAEETVVGLAASQTRYRANRYGLYHMSGNVTEWTQSVSVPFSRHRPYRNDERNRDDTPGQRVARGGSWYSASVALLGTSYRESFPPEHSTRELGFRVVARRLP